MNRISMCVWTMAAALTLAPAAIAQETVSSGQAQGHAAAQGGADAMTKPAGGQTQAGAQANAQASAEAKADVRATLEKIKTKGAKVSAEARQNAEAKMDAAVKAVDAEAQANGDAKIAARLAAEFGMTAEALLAEKQSLGVSWGQLMIAHSLMANSATVVTAENLLQLREEGAGWGQIAAGLGLRLGDAVSAIRAESRVATGLAKADGRVATIRGEGARVGANAAAGANAGVRAGGVGAGASAGVGVRIKP
jgi:hypothetical protein